MTADPDDSRSIHRVLLGAERLRNARRATLLRAVIVGAFFLTEMLLVVVLERWSWHPGTTVFAAYFLLSVLVWVIARFSERITLASSLAIPILDMPAVFLLVLRGSETGDSNNLMVSSFALLSIYMLMIVIAALTMQGLIVAVSAGVGLFLIFAHAYATQLTPDHAPFITLLTLSFATVTLYILHRLRALVRSAASQQVRLERLHRYFNPTVARLVEESQDDDTPDTRVITVLFSDIRGFTRLTQKLPPDRIMDLLSEYHSTMVDQIFSHGGTLDKFIGDGLMAYFNAPLDQPDHSARALRCAASMSDALEELNRKRTGRGESALDIGIGIHTGPATLGTIGTKHRREYTAVGTTVNVAAHLEKLTRETGARILLTEATQKLLEPAVFVESLPQKQIPGIDHEVQLYRYDPIEKV